MIENLRKYTGLMIVVFVILFIIALLAVYLMVMGEVFLATAAGRDFRMSLAWFGPTELRIMLAIGALTLFRDPYVGLGELGRYRLFDVAGAAATLGLLIVFIVNVARNGRALALAERPKTAGINMMITMNPDTMDTNSGHFSALRLH